MKKRTLSILLILALCIGLLAAGNICFAAADVDLSVSALYWNAPTEVKPGTEIIFTAKVKNNGTEAVTDPFEVKFGTANQVFSKVTYSEGIPAGGEVIVKSEPWKAVEGDIMVAVRVNSTQTVAENSFKNNTAQTGLRVANDKLQPSEFAKDAVEAAGMTSLVFSDDFDDLDFVDSENTGLEGYKWYVKRPYGAATLTPNDYSVQDGILNLHLEKSTYNYGLATYNHSTRNGFTYTKGYMEIRLRIPSYDPDKSGGPAIWALPTTKLTNQATEWIELDWMEYWGITDKRPGGYYTICLHEQHLTGPIADNNVATHYKNSNYMYTGLGDGEWHTMGWLWKDGFFMTYLDGQVVMSLSYDAKKDPIPKHGVVKGKDSIGVFSMLDQQLMPIIINGSKANNMEVDYVRVWNVNEYYTADDAAADEFVGSYAKDIKTVDATNYATILSGEAQWGKLSDAAKAKVNERLAEKELPAFTELLSQAKTVEAGLNATEPTEPVGGQEKPDNSAVLYVAIGAGVVLILVIVMILVKKRRK